MPLSETEFLDFTNALFSQSKSIKINQKSLTKSCFFWTQPIPKLLKPVRLNIALISLSLLY